MPVARDDLISVRTRRYLAKDFDAFRAQMFEYARLYFPDRLRDFSESSIGGLFLDFASSALDSMSFFLDHQFGELDPETVVESANIERMLRQASVPIVGATPALVPVTIYIEVPAKNSGNSIAPDEVALPIVQMRSVFSSNSGINFILLEDLDFSSRKSDNTLVAEVRVGQKTTTGTPTTFILALTGLCSSGQIVTETVSLGSFVPFRKITLGNANVSEVISVIDGQGNTYYEVNHLTQDVVFKNIINTGRDSDLVKDSLKLLPAPYRYTSATDISTREMTLTLGGGDAVTLEDDIIPDPSDFAIAFPYTRTFSRVAVNPQQLLQTKTLGVSASNTSLTITYRYGGGLNHNVAANNIQTVLSLRMIFPKNPTPVVAGNVRSSTAITNKVRASGGEDAPDVDTLKALIPAYRNAQERVVSKEDLLARVYTMPSNFGRVFRAAVRSNPNNPLATQLFIVSRDAQSKLITSPDVLKENLVKYLKPYRLISDAIDILDSAIIDLRVTFEVLIDPTLNKSVVLQNVLAKLQKFFDVKNFNIDQPIVTADVVNNIFSTHGVVSVNNIKFENLVGVIDNKTYSNVVFDVPANTRQGIVFPSAGAIFNVRYPEINIIGRTSS